MTGTLGVLSQPEAEAESQLDQVGKVTGFGIGDGGRHGHNRLDDDEGAALS